MKKKTVVIFTIALGIMLILQFISPKAQKVLLVGRLMGFEIDSGSQVVNTGKTIPASSRKIGTVTFIKADTNEFVALGHSSDTDNEESKIITGQSYGVNFEGIKKATRENTGNIVASINRDSKTGYIYNDTAYGIFGKVDKIEDGYQEIETAKWYDVKKGKASILIAFEEGEEPRSYDVEITRIDYFNKNKNIKMKVKDKELIKKAGGIVQGMSGTPLIQNGKLIGAVNFVSTENPSIAYAIFVDKLL